MRALVNKAADVLRVVGGVPEGGPDGFLAAPATVRTPYQPPAMTLCGFDHRPASASCILQGRLDLLVGMPTHPVLPFIVPGRRHTWNGFFAPSFLRDRLIQIQDQLRHR